MIQHLWGVLCLWVAAAYAASTPPPPPDPKTPNPSANHQPTAPVNPWALDQPAAVLAQAEQALAQGHTKQALRLGAHIANTWPDTEHAYVASYLPRRAQAVPVQPQRIGLLLPASGKYQAVAAQVQAALELGYRSHGGTLAFQSIDAGETPKSTVAALESLVLQQGVVAVLGPLLTDVAGPAVRAANALRTPIVGLHQAGETTLDRPWAFQAFISPRQFTRALVDYAITIRNMRSFAVFAPDTPYGRASTAAFEHAVTAAGGTIPVQVYYDATATDLVPFAKQLATNNLDARLEALTDPPLQAPRSERDQEPLPLVDFDAIFLPDSARRIPIACASLAYANFPVGEFQTVRGGPTVPMLGLSGWNNPTLFASGGPYVRGAVFTDVYLPSHPSSTVFKQAFIEALGREPSTLEAMAYDTGVLLAAALHHPVGSRQAFREALLQATTADQVTGLTRWDPSHRTGNYPIKLLSANKDGIYVLNPPQASDPSPPNAPDTTPTSPN